MQVMSNYEFFDKDVEKVLYNVEIGANEEIREIVFKDEDHVSLNITKQDVIALAKEFGLVVYECNANY